MAQQDTAGQRSDTNPARFDLNQLNLVTFQQEVADEIGIGRDALSRLVPQRQQIQELEQKFHGS